MKKLEFSKLIVFLNWLVFASWVTFSYILAFYEKNPNETVTVTVVTACLGSTLGYFIQNALRTNSANRNGINAGTGKPFVEEINKIINNLEDDKND